MNIAIVGSGGGTNAAALMAHFSEVPEHDVVLVLSNRAEAGILQQAQSAGVPGMALDRAHATDAGYWLDVLTGYDVDIVALAGYLKKVPKGVVQAYAGRILNTHPALLPKHGGHGMYGLRVHKAVIAAGEQRSGMTIHHVTDEYDEGEVVFQEAIDVPPDWTPEQLQQAVKALEHKHFPRVLQQFCTRLSDKRP